MSNVILDKNILHDRITAGVVIGGVPVDRAPAGVATTSSSARTSTESTSNRGAAAAYDGLRYRQQFNL